MNYIEIMEKRFFTVLGIGIAISAGGLILCYIAILSYLFS